MKDPNVAMDQLHKKNIHSAVAATVGTDSEPPASLMSSEHTRLPQNPRLSFVDEDYVAGRRVPFTTLHSDSLESSSEKMLSPEKLVKTSSSEKTSSSFYMSEVAASAAVKSVTGIRDSIHDTLAISPTTNVLVVAVVNEIKSEHTKE
jgi:hypothetical protein